jgi:hypothetical protein
LVFSFFRVIGLLNANLEGGLTAGAVNNTEDLDGKGFKAAGLNGQSGTHGAQI